MCVEDLYSCYFDKLLSDLEKIASRGVYNFGYIERMILERTLFAVLKLWVRDRLGIELHGFSESYKLQLLDLLKRKGDERHVFLTCKMFDLKNYLRSLSCENPYVRGDSISKLNVGKDKVFVIIRSQIQGIRRLIFEDLKIKG